APSYRLASVSQRCDEPTLAALLETTAGGGQRALPLPIVPPVTETGAPEATCSSLPNLRLSPIDADDAQGLGFAIGAEVVSIDAKPSAGLVAPREKGTSIPGSARSPDGSALAIATPRGVLVQSAGGHPRLLTGPEVAQAWGCTAANDGARVACVVRGS